MRNSDIDYLKKYLDSDKLDEGIELLKKGISPQYIVGNVCFYGNVSDSFFGLHVRCYDVVWFRYPSIYYPFGRFN